jgi:hypothetical protein
MSEDLIAFVRARLDEDEQVARSCVMTASDSIKVGLSVTLWKARDIGGPELPSVWNGTAVVARELSDEDAEHIARWDPVRVLAEVEAKRRMLNEAIRLMRYDGEFEFLEILALPHASHPDYRPEWRPAAE